MKIKQRHRDRMATYLRWWRVGRADRFTLHGPGEALAKARARAQMEGKLFQSPPGSKIPSTLEVFTRYESTGCLWVSDDSRTLDRAMCGKALLALQIKMWAKGMAEGLHGTVELEEGCPQWLPGWVWRSVRTQSMKCKPLF